MNDMNKIICARCGTSDPTLHYRSGKMRNCVDCQHFFNLTAKSPFDIYFTHEEFLQWKRELPERRQCVYCGIDSHRLYAMNAQNRSGKRLEVIGVDRIDNDEPYTLANIQPCCALCNSIKSKTLTHSEMMQLGPVLRTIWAAR